MIQNLIIWAVSIAPMLWLFRWLTHKALERVFWWLERRKARRSGYRFIETDFD